MDGDKGAVAPVERVTLYFSGNRNGMHCPHRIDGTSLYMETTFSANATMTQTIKLLKHFGYAETDLSVTCE